MKHAVIVIAGHRCAGKSTVAEALRRAGHSVLDMGTLLGPLGFRRYFNDEPLPVRFLIERYGGGHSVFPLFAGTICRMTKRRRLLFIDSAKAAADVQVLADILPGAEVRTLYLDCDFATRHRRYMTRGREFDRSADALREADDMLHRAGLARLRARASWRLVTEEAAPAIETWLENELPRFLRGQRIVPARRPAPLPEAAIIDGELNEVFAPLARDALHGVAKTGPLADAPSALEAALEEAARARTDWQRLNAIRVHERALRGTARPMDKLALAYERAMRGHLRRLTGWRSRPPPKMAERKVLVSPFWASLTPFLVRARDLRPADFILAASASDAADYGRLRRLAAERLELRR